MSDIVFDQYLPTDWHLALMSLDYYKERRAPPDHDGGLTGITYCTLTTCLYNNQYTTSVYLYQSTWHWLFYYTCLLVFFQ